MNQYRPSVEYCVTVSLSFRPISRKKWSNKISIILFWHAQNIYYKDSWLSVFCKHMVNRKNFGGQNFRHHFDISEVLSATKFCPPKLCPSFWVKHIFYSTGIELGRSKLILCLASPTRVSQNCAHFHFISYNLRIFHLFL